VLPDASSGQAPSTLASFARQGDFSCEGVKAVTVQACLAAAGRQGGYGVVFANHG